jgi:hypothetical protein
MGCRTQAPGDLGGYRNRFGGHSPDLSFSLLDNGEDVGHLPLPYLFFQVPDSPLNEGTLLNGS